MTHTIVGDDSAILPEHGRSQYWSIGISGLSCAGEAAGLERRLRKVGGVEDVTVNPLTERAYVAFDPDRFDPAALVLAIQAAGYCAR